MNNIESIIAEVKKLQESVAKLEEENKALRKRVGRLEAGTDKDLRLKAAVRVLGFTLSNVNGYYNAVRTVNGSQIRIYIGKKKEVAEKKIMAYLLDNVTWLRSDIEVCEDLMAVEQLAQAVEKANRESEKEQPEEQNENALDTPVDMGDGVTKVAVKNYKNE